MGNYQPDDAWTHTSRGRAMDLRAPVAEDIDIAEIASSLGHQCRYAGCVRDFYSVAEHSVHIARWLLDEHGDRQLALAGLLHDAAEAYTGDITYPMQALLWSVSSDAEATYKAAQHRLDVLIAERAGVPVALLHDPRVKEADLKPLAVDIGCWGVWEATDRWLAAYHAFGGAE